MTVEYDTLEEHDHIQNYEDTRYEVCSIDAEQVLLRQINNDGTETGDDDQYHIINADDFYAVEWVRPATGTDDEAVPTLGTILGNIEKKRHFLSGVGIGSVLAIARFSPSILYAGVTVAAVILVGVIGTVRHGTDTGLRDATLMGIIAILGIYFIV